MKIHICFALDENYIKPLAAAIMSVMRNSSPENQINFYILSNDLSDQNKQKLSKMKTSNCNIEYLQVNENLFKNCPLNIEWISVVTYYRLSLPSLLPNIDKIIYLDPDVIVNADIAELFSLNIEDFYAAGVQDLGHIDRKGMPPSKTHINAGVLLLNLKKMREDKIEEQFFDFINENYENPNMVLPEQDQTLINLIMSSKIKRLHFRWNVQCFKLPCNRYDPEVIEGIENLAIIHFRGDNKPWLKSNVPNSNFYFKYLNQTPFLQD